jgi:DNA gyrase/topoisomerase IV subunit B
MDLAYNNPGLKFVLNGESFLFKKGLFELAQRIRPEFAQTLGDENIVIETQNSKNQLVKAKITISLSVSFDPESEERERFISFVNSTPTFDGGYHVERVKRNFVAAVKEKADRLLKKEKVTVMDHDVLQGMVFVLGIIMPNPRFESQTKRKLVRDHTLEKALDSFLSEGVEKFVRKNKEYVDIVAERAQARHRMQELKDASKQGKKQKKQRVDKLLDANERKDRSKCMLFICEGDSAIGGLRSSRDKMIQGGIALKGKPMNVSQATIKDVLNNQEFADIMASIGLTIGEKVDIPKLRYSKIIFLADSDVDGGHINTLLTNFFFTYWPEMFSMGMVHIAKAPLFEVITDKGTIYAETEEELEKVKLRTDIKVREIQRNKGLGEMSPEAWKHVVTRKVFTVITVEDMLATKNILNVCFGKESQLRKDLLIDHEKGL